MSLVALLLLPLLARSAFAVPVGTYAGLGLGLDVGLETGPGAGLGPGLGAIAGLDVGSLGLGGGLDASLGVGLGAGAGLGAIAGLDVGSLGLGGGLDASLGVGLDAGAGTGGYGLGYNGGQGLRAWPYDNYGPLTDNSILDYANPLAYGAEVYATPYVYDDYPRTVDYARENYIRRYPVVASEVGIRDQFSFRPGYAGVPYSRYYATYFPYGGGVGWRNAFF